MAIKESTGRKSSFSVRILDAHGRELSVTQEPTLHVALALARERLQERTCLGPGAQKAEVRDAHGLVYDLFAE